MQSTWNISKPDFFRVKNLSQVLIQVDPDSIVRILNFLSFMKINWRDLPGAYWFWCIAKEHEQWRFLLPCECLIIEQDAYQAKTGYEAGQNWHFCTLNWAGSWLSMNIIVHLTSWSPKISYLTAFYPIKFLPWRLTWKPSVSWVFDCLCHSTRWLSGP